MTFPKTVVAPPGRAARAPIISSATTTPVVAPALPPLGQALRGAHWAADRRRPIPRLDWLSRLSFSLVPAPLAGPPSSTWCLPGLREFACPRGAEGSDLGVEGEDVGRVRGGICVPCSAATLWAGNEVSGEAVVARSTISCYLLTHQVHPRRACGFLVLLPPVK